MTQVSPTTAAEDEVVKALDCLEAKREWSELSPPITPREQAAYERLFDALIHVREVAWRWDDKACALLKDARSLLAEEYAVTRRSPLRRQDLYRCEQAIRIVEEGRQRSRTRQTRTRD